MSKITAEMWEKAINIAQNRIQELETNHLGGSMYDTLVFIVSSGRFAPLRDRYNAGERSIELYNAIVEFCNR